MSGTLKQLGQTGTIAQQRSLSSTSQLTAPSIQRFSGMVELLTPPTSLDDLDVNQGMVVDILLRLSYNEGEVSATHAEEVLKLPYRLIDDLLAWMQQEHMLEVAKAVGSLPMAGETEPKKLLSELSMLARRLCRWKNIQNPFWPRPPLNN
jgi:hypothetical protein